MLDRFTPWDLDFRQLGPGDLRSEVVLHGVADCMVSKIQMNCAVHQTGAPPQGYLTFGIPDTDGLDNWQAQEISGDPLLTFGSATGFESCSNERHKGLNLVFSEAMFIDFAYAIGLDVPERVMSTSAFDPDEQTNRLRFLKQRIEKLLSSETVLWTKPLMESLALDVLSILYGGAAEYDDRPVHNRRYVLGKAVELMALSEEDIIPISELCRKVGASWRTINRAFLEEFGVGPKAYFNRLRLNRVRFELVRTKGEISVAEAANRFDFWHMGQFAKDYSALFGELPSQTLRRLKSQPDPGWR